MNDSLTPVAERGSTIGFLAHLMKVAQEANDRGRPAALDYRNLTRAVMIHIMRYSDVEDQMLIEVAFLYLTGGMIPVDQWKTELVKERERQIAKFGEQLHVSEDTMWDVLVEEMGEVSQEIDRLKPCALPDEWAGHWANFRKECIQVAAVCLKWYGLR